MFGPRFGFLRRTIGATLLIGYDFSDPGDLPTLSTEARASAITVPISAATADSFASGVKAIGFDAAFAAASKRALYCNNPFVNLIADSKDMTGWVNAGTTDTPDDATAPDTAGSADKVTATANPGFIETPSITATQPTIYTVSAWHKRATGSDVSGQFRIFSGGYLSDDPSWAWTSVAAYKIDTAVFTTASTALFIDWQITASAEATHVWGFQVELGTGRGGHAPTTGSVAAVVQSNWQDAGNFVNEDIGEINVVFVIKKLPPSGDTHFIFDTETAADRRALSVDSAGLLKFLVNDSAGSLVATLTLGTIIADTEYTAVCQWDKGAGFSSNSVRAKVNAEATIMGGAAFTSGGGFTAKICLGASGTTVDTALDGYIRTLKSYNGEQTSI